MISVFPNMAMGMDLLEPEGELTCSLTLVENTWLLEMRHKGLSLKHQSVRVYLRRQFALVSFSVA